MANPDRGILHNWIAWLLGIIVLGGTMLIPYQQAIGWVLVAGGATGLLLVLYRLYSFRKSGAFSKEAPVYVSFGFFDSESGIMGHRFRGSYGVDVINHKPHDIRVIDRWVERQIPGGWEKIDYVRFDERMNRVEWESAGRLYAKEIPKLPKTLTPNERFLYRIELLPLREDGETTVRGVIVADGEKYCSKPVVLPEHE